MSLPALKYEDLTPTRDYLQDVAKVLGKLQQLFLEEQPHDWHRGLEVSKTGLMTQPFTIHGEGLQALLDFELDCVELDHTSWSLHDCSAQELLDDVQHFLADRGVHEQLDHPEFTTEVAQYDPQQAKALAAAMWWIQNQFEDLQHAPRAGLHSPVLLFPHHFDLSLVWFPHGNDDQLSLGFSLGDDDVSEPYFYSLLWPESAAFEHTNVASPARWQSEGFKGWVLTYADVATSDQPEALLKDFWRSVSSSIS